MNEGGDEQRLPALFSDDQVRVVVLTWVGDAPKHSILSPIKPAGYRELLNCNS